MPQREVHLVAPSAHRLDLLDRAECWDEQRQGMRAEIPERTMLAPPRRPAERIPRLENRREPNNAAAVPVVTVDLTVEPRADTGVEATREEDHGRRACRLYDPLGRLDRQRQRLLEEQRASRPTGAHGQLGLDIRRNRKGDG